MLGKVIMFNIVIDIFKNITGIIKNLNLTKEQAVIAICIIISVGSIWVASHYKNETSNLAITLEDKELDLKEANENAKVAVSLEKYKKLEKNYNSTTRELANLYKKYTDLIGSGTTYTKIMEGLGDINNTQDICDAWVRLYGLHICE